ncbi:MAG: HIT domain-containing protein [Caulobacteraceae bacterium]
MNFQPHPDFEGTSHPVCDLPLCHVRLHDDARFPWLILIPRVAAARELIDLSRDDRIRLMDEVEAACEAVRALGVSDSRPVEKLNVAALGNVTPQLHVHVIGRRADDAAWPRPVWNQGQPEAYARPFVANALQVLKRAFDERA